MRPAGGAVRDRALHFRHAPRRLCRSSLAPAHQAVALSPFIDNPRRNASSPATPLLARGRPRSSPCLRLVAPVENRARLGFATLASRVFALPPRSCRMVSSRACSSPMPQPASRHSIKPFSILLSRRQVGVYSWSWRMELYISSCHHSQHSLRSRIQIVRWSAAWGRRGIRCEAVSKSPYDLRWGDGRTANVSMKANKESTVPLSNSNSPLQLNNDSKHTTIRIYRKGGEAFRGL